MGITIIDRWKKLPLERKIAIPAALLAMAVAGMILMLAAVRMYRGIPAIFDDAFMFVRYARNLLHEGMYSWNGDTPTFGCTSILYTFWICIWTALGLDGNEQGLLIISSLTFSGVSIFLFLRILRRLFPAQPLRWIWLLPMVASFVFVGNSLTGMDTTMAMAALLLMLDRWLIWTAKDSRNNLILAAIFSYLPFLVRPDTGVYVLMFPVLWLWANGQVKKMIPTYLILGAFLSLDTLVKWWYFGDPMPLPYYAKSGDYLEGYLGMYIWPVNQYWLYFLAVGIPPLLLAGISSISIRWKKLIAFLLPMMITLGVLTLKVQIMGGFARFFFPSIPFLMLAGLVQFRGENMQLRWYVVLTLWAGMGFAGIFLTEFYETKVEEEELEVYEIQGADVNPEGIYVATQLYDLLALLPDGSTVAASEHGIMSIKYPRLHILDLAGLHDPVIAKEGYSDEYLREQNPAVIWMPHDHYVGMIHKMRQGEWFQSAYEYFPGVYFFGIAIRKDLPNFSELRQQIVQESP